MAGLWTEDREEREQPLGTMSKLKALFMRTRDIVEKHPWKTVFSNNGIGGFMFGPTLQYLEFPNGFMDFP